MKNLGVIASILSASAPSPRGSALVASGYGDDDYFGEVGTLEVAGPAYGGGAMRFRPAPRMQQNNMRQVPRQYLIPQNPGVPGPGLKLQPLGLSSIAFTAASGTALSMTASPQRPFKAKRLIMDFTRSGATATGLITVTSINVGTDNQLVGTGPLPAAAFSVTAFDANIAFAPATPGIQIAVGVSTSLAPTAPDRIDVAGALFGTSLG